MYQAGAYADKIEGGRAPGAGLSPSYEPVEPPGLRTPDFRAGGALVAIIPRLFQPIVESRRADSDR